MLQRNPETPNELPPTAEILQSRNIIAQEAIDTELKKYIRRRAIKQSIARVCLTTGLLTSVHASLYISDVRHNMLESEDAKPSVSTIHEALIPENNTHVNVFFNGFNSYDADYLVDKLGPGYQAEFDGQNWSVQYNNAILDPDAIAKELAIEFEEQGITSADFIGYSMGDVPMADAAVYTVAETDVDLYNVSVLSGPADFDTLTPKTKEELSIAKSLAWIPWIEYSTPFRYGLEVYFYRNDVQKNVSNAIGGINTRFINGDVTSNAFLASQINSVSESNISQRLQEIAEYKDTKHMPNVNTIMIETDERTQINKDIVVDNDASNEKIREAAEKAGLNFNETRVDSQHGLYYFPKAVEEYNRAFSDIGEDARNQTSREKARLLLNLYGYFAQDPTNPFNLNSETTLDENSALAEDDPDN